MTNPIERFLPVVDGKRDRRIQHTPHYQLLQHYKKVGERLYVHDYAKLAAVRGALQGKDRSDQFLRRKVDAVCDLFDSMKEHGYCGGPFRDDLISVFESPIYPPGKDYEPLNFEILGGHHRAAAAAAIGMEKVQVLVVRVYRVRRIDTDSWMPWQEDFWLREPPLDVRTTA